jgi:hypothetical protein
METINKMNIEKTIVTDQTKTMNPSEKSTVEVPLIPRDIVYVLDESGSMSSMGNEPKDSVNRTVADQKALNIPGTHFTLIKFNSSVTVVYDDVPLEDVPEFTDYQPKEMTALYDAIGTAIDNKKAKGEGKYENVICVILTDGMENCSKDYVLDSKTKKNAIKTMIKEMKEKHSWQFIYAAANQDAFAIGATMGMHNCVDYEPTQFGMQYMSREISGGIGRMRSGESTSVEIMNGSVSAPPVFNLAPDSPRTPPHAPRMTRGFAGGAFGSPPKLTRSKRLRPVPPPLRIPKGEGDGDSDDEFLPEVTDFSNLITLKKDDPKEFDFIPLKRS